MYAEPSILNHLLFVLTGVSDQRVLHGLSHLGNSLINHDMFMNIKWHSSSNTTALYVLVIININDFKSFDYNNSMH